MFKETLYVMLTMKLLMFLLFADIFNGNNLLLDRIPDYMRQLCPKSHVCNANDSMVDGDPKSCCTDCSCKPDCADKGKCCFVSRTHASEPSTIDVISPIATTEDDRVQCLYPVTGESEMFDFLKILSYNMLSSPNDKNTSNENGSCANKKVAPWGNLYPVYSKQTDKIYINDICAQEYNVTDGVVWKAIFTCKSILTHNLDIAEYFAFIENGDIPEYCRIYFNYPGDLIDIRSHRCFKDMIDYCRVEDFQVPLYLNATKVDISVACQSGLLSPYYSTFNLYANVFCFICSGLRFDAYERCEKYQASKGQVGQTNFAALLDPVAIATMTSFVDRGPMACRINENQNVSHCRPVLCPSAQIRHSNGKCEFPAKVWYRQLYSIAIELRIEQQIDLKEAFYWQDDLSFISDKDMQHLNMSNSVILASWVVNYLLYQSKPQDTSRPTNTLLVYLIRYFDTSNPTDIIRKMSLLINKKWLLPYKNETLVLKPSLFKLKYPFYDEGLLNSGQFKVNDSYIVVYLPYKRFYISVQDDMYSFFMTTLYFCDQVELGNGEYIISTDRKVLYNKFTNNYLFDGEFIDLDGHVKICYENSGFVKQIAACANVHIQSALSSLYIIQVLLCFVFFQRYLTF